MNKVAVNESFCSSCGTSMGTRPFCARDGAIGRGGRFVVGTRYAAEELLGTGTHTFVYAGRHLTLGKPVAIKVLRDGDAMLAQRFLREARGAAQLNHDNTISIIDFGREEAISVAYVVMELFSGQSLDRVLRASGAMPAARAIPILVQLARSLANAHMAGVIHRDVNPRNVLVGRDDLVKLGDFGLAQRNDSSGSPDDISAFAATAIEMLLGRKPSSPVAMLDALRSEVPRPMWLLLEQCLSSDPAARPRAIDLETQLLAIKSVPAPIPVVATTPARSKPITAQTPIRTRASRNTAPLTVAPLRPTPTAAIVALPPALTPVAAPPPPAIVEPPPPAIVEPPAPRAAPTGTGQLIGVHRIVGLIGKGSASSVYLAEHPATGANVAIKVIAPEIAAIPGNAERVVAEARMIGKLEVAAIPRYLDLGVLATGQPYTVMDHLRGESLAALVGRGKVSVARTKELVAQVATAMALVHAGGHVHGGLRASNVFVVETGGIKILDAGVAKALTRDVIDAASDVAGLGAMIVEILADTPPPRVADTIARMTARKLTMTEVVAELDGWLEAPPVVAAPVIEPLESIEPLETLDDDNEAAIVIPRPRRWPWFAGGGVAAAAVVAVIAFASGGDARPAPKPPAAKLAAPVAVGATTPPPPPPAPKIVAPDPEPVAPPPEVVAPPPPPVATTPPATPSTTVAATPPPKPKTKPTKHHDDAVIVDPFAP
jgi:eukaryotic-like serine/threonine-protein kinase